MNQSTSTPLQIKDCQFEYTKGKTILKIDDLSVQSGEKIFLYGPSGCGKSTLLNLITGITKPTHGNLVVLDQPFHQLSSGKRDLIRGQKMGVIFQIFNLVSYLNVEENILLPVKLNKKKVTSNTIAYCEQLLKRLNLSEFKSQKIHTLSIGQQQRVAIARALITEPELLIADEPTSSLDEENTAEFMKILNELHNEKKFTLIFVSHDKRLEKYFDRSLSLLDLNSGSIK